MNLLQRFREFIQQKNLFYPKDKLLLAVSGGIDSVVLCELCKQSGYDFAIAHCNFKLRGEESERDEKFVESLAEKYGVWFYVREFETEKYAGENKLSIQEAARELRYEWFGDLLSKSLYSKDNYATDYNWLLTAHHADDNIETMLMNFIKGTGIAGLRGMLPKNDKIIRPLLFANKDDIRTFAEENELKWTEDSSNKSQKYSRNYFRLQIIPLIEKIYPAAIQNLTDNLERFRDIELLYQQAISQHKKKLLEKKGNEIHISVMKLKKSVPLKTVVYEIIRESGFSPQQVNEIIELLEAQSGKYIQSETHRIIRNRKWLIINSNKTEEPELILIEEGTKEVKIGNKKIKIQNIKLPTHNLQFPTSNLIACVDTGGISFPLILRKWKQGDYFYPLGMKKKKKLSRFFIDSKLSKTEKENSWILEMDKKIIWVVGMRIDDRFKITAKTKNGMQMTLSS
jgi:tRNA(Ile)-lysidine synthase